MENSPKPNPGKIEYHLVGGNEISTELYREARALTTRRIEGDDFREDAPVLGQAYPEKTVWVVAREADAVVGAGFIREINGVGPSKLEIDEIAVHEDHTRKGIGGEMLRLLEKEAHELGATALEATPVTVESYDFLVKSGFEHDVDFEDATREQVPPLRKNIKPQDRNL